MDPGGMLRLWLMRYRTGRQPAILWQPTRTLWGVWPTVAMIADLEIGVRLRLLRFIACLGELRAGRRAPLSVRAFAEAACVGAPRRAVELLDHWMEGEALPARLHQRCDRIQRRLAHRVRSVLHSAREDGGILWLIDLPVTLLPFAISLHRRMLGPRPLIVHCGGGRLWPGLSTWAIDRDGTGEVLRRSSGGFSPFERAAEHREAFEPTAGGPP